MRTSALMLLCAASLVAQQGSIDGVVLNQTTGQPIGGVHVRLFVGMVSQIATQAFGATTNAEGRFSVGAIPPGTYTVELERAGFLQVPGTVGYSHTTEVSLRPGDHLTGRQLAMLPLFPIEGRVVNQYGDPVPGAQVQAALGTLDSRSQAPQFSAKTVDERGRFRLFVVPGKYYIVAGPLLSMGVLGPAEIRTDGTSDLAYSPTYYPDSTDIAAAKTVDVKPDAGVTGIEIHLASGAVRRNLSVSGTVTGIPAGAQATVAYQYGASQGQFSMGNFAVRVDADGHFSFDNLPPGYVRMVAQCSSGGVALQSELVDIHLEAPGASNVHLALTPGGAVTGVVEGTGPGKFNLRFSPSGPGLVFPIPRPIPIESDGAFRVSGIAPGRYRVDVEPLPENGYIKSIIVNDVAVSDGTLDFSSGVRGPRVKVTVGLDGAQISGEVRDSDGGPLLNKRVVAFLIPEANQPAPLRTGAGVVEGRYVFKGLPPGKYRLFAVDSGGLTLEARSALARTAELVSVETEGRLTKDLKVIVPGEANARPKQ